jgi:precorrin-6A synthase
MKKILIIGIGAGDPEQITIQAVNALNRTDVFFMLEKGASKDKLMALRREICRRYIAKTHQYRFLDATSPDWERKSADYGATMQQLNADKQAVHENLIEHGLKDGETGAFLIWGDPGLYDSTIRNMDAIVRRGRLDFEFEIIPGISSIQALTAKHKIAFNSLSQPVMTTTGRRLAEGFPDGTDTAVVMLDAKNVYKKYRGQDIDIYWGAYVGTPDEILISGPLDEVADKIEQARAEARAANGWIMDSYLLRKRGMASDEGEE